MNVIFTTLVLIAGLLGLALIIAAVTFAAWALGYYTRKERSRWLKWLTILVAIDATVIFFCGMTELKLLAIFALISLGLGIISHEPVAVTTRVYRTVVKFIDTRPMRRPRDHNQN